MNLKPKASQASQASHTTVSETELASASAVHGRREEATDDRLCDDLYDLACLGPHLALHMTDSLFCIPSRTLFCSLLSGFSLCI